MTVQFQIATIIRKILIFVVSANYIDFQQRLENF